MKKVQETPVALTIAGSDSGGGAGIQADLKTFASLNVHGTCAITCITAQNPKGVSGIQACRTNLIAAQIDAVFRELPPAVVKTGMLFSAGIIRIVANTLRTFGPIPIVVDPVMISTSGVPLLQKRAVSSLEKELFPMASLITPNVDEAQVLSGIRIRNPEDLRTSARILHSKYGCVVLVKGGHLAKLREAADIFYDGRTELLLTAPFIRGVATHGTGCTYSAAIASYIALGNSLQDSVEQAKTYVTGAIAHSRKVARHSVLNHQWKI